MRTLKKTMALVLVFVLCFSFIGSAFALSFDDDDEIQYKEAVDVMTSIGAIAGMGDGTFNPTGLVTRAQAAKMVAYAILGENVASMLPNNGSSFTDVPSPAYDWAIPGIEYLVKIGAIAGMGDGTFDPGGSVTGYQIAKMMLCAAGYGKNGEFVGVGWDLNVATLAFSLGIFKGSEGKVASYNAPATREECALYTFNGITKVDRVVWDTDKSEYAPAAIAGTIASVTYGSLLVNQTAKGSGKDMFGRPSSKWTFKGEVVGAYPIAPVAVFTAFTSEKQVETATKGYTIVASSLTSFINGSTFKTASMDDANDADEVSALTDNGLRVELYASQGGRDIDVIVLIQTELFVVNSVNATTKAVKLVSMSDNTLISTAGAGIPAYKTTDDEYEYLKDLEKDDLVLAIPYWDGSDHDQLVGFSAPGYAQGAITSVINPTATAPFTKLVLNGTTYNAGYSRTAAPFTPAAEAAIVLDGYGYALAIVDSSAAAADAEYFYGIESYQTVVNGQLAYMIHGVWNDGTVAELRANSSGTADAAVNKVNKPGTAPADGKYTNFNPITASTPSSSGDLLSAGSVTSLGTTNTSASGFILATDIQLTEFSANPEGDATNEYVNYYATDVKFIFINPVDYTVSVKTGVQDVIGIPLNSYALSEGAQELITTVFIWGIQESYDASALLFVATSTSYGTSLQPDGTTPSVYAGYINGDEPVTFIAKEEPDVGFHTYSVSANGMYTLKPVTNQLLAATITSLVPNTLFKVDPGGGNDKPLNLSTAQIIDLRPDQASVPITLTPAGLVATEKAGDPAVACVAYDTKGVAIYVYIIGTK